MVRRVVVSYSLGWLPGDWLQTWRRLDRVFARANLKVKAGLHPLEDLPEDTDILVVPPELARRRTRARAPRHAHPGHARGIRRRRVRRPGGVAWKRVKNSPPNTSTLPTEDAPNIVSYRGHTLIE